MSNADPIAFLFTWSTYGTWLPGDKRGWVEYRKGYRLPDPIRELEAKAKMTETACRLNTAERNEIHLQVAETCEQRNWTLHAVNCRSNHIHVVTSASRKPMFIRHHLKSWCTRRLSDFQKSLVTDPELWRENWWADRGSIRWIFDMDSLEAAILYVRDQQDNPNRFRV
jgi:REP element-mobilizing transposase RayT